MSGQVSGIRYQVSGSWYQVSGDQYQVSCIPGNQQVLPSPRSPPSSPSLSWRPWCQVSVPGVLYWVPGVRCQVSGVRCFVSSTCYKCPSSPPPLSPSPLPSPCRRAAETPGNQILFRVKTNLDRHFNKSCLEIVRNAHRLLLLRVDVRPLGVRHLALPVGETSGDQVVR